MVNRKGIPCIRVKFMKKTEYITYRTDKEIKDILIGIAEEKKWSISQLSEEIIRQWLQEHHGELLAQPETALEKE